MQGRGWVTSGGSGSGGAFVCSGPHGAALGDARGRGGAGGQAGGGEGAGVGAGKGAGEGTVEGGVEPAARGRVRLVPGREGGGVLGAPV